MGRCCRSTVMPEPRNAECGHLPHYGKGLCKPCYMLRWKKANPDRVAVHNLRRRPQQRLYGKFRRKRDRQKILAWRCINEGVRAGKIQPQPCTHCGKAKAEAGGQIMPVPPDYRMFYYCQCCGAKYEETATSATITHCARCFGRAFTSTPPRESIQPVPLYGYRQWGPFGWWSKYE